MYFTSVEDAGGLAVDVSMWTWRKFVEVGGGENVQAVTVPEFVRFLSVDEEMTAEPGQMLVMRGDGGVGVWESGRFKTRFVSLEVKEQE